MKNKIADWLRIVWDIDNEENVILHQTRSLIIDELHGLFFVCMTKIVI